MPSRAAGLPVVVAVVVCASAGFDGGCAQAPVSTPPATPTTTPLLGVAPPSPPKTLYERLGGKAAIEAVIDRFIGNVVADDRINHRFAFTDVPVLRGHLVDQVCTASGGPCTYKGRSMLVSHKGQRIDEAAWNALVQDLVAALDHLQVPAAEKGELLGALGALHDDIVEVSP